MKDGESLSIESWLTRYGWTYERAESDTWLTGWQGDTKSYSLTVHLTETWILFEIPSFIDLDIDFHCWPELTRTLLEINNEVHLVKIDIDEDNQINLSIQLFARNIDFQIFSDTLGVLGYYADMLYARIVAESSRIGVFKGYDKTFLTPN